MSLVDRMSAAPLDAAGAVNDAHGGPGPVIRDPHRWHRGNHTGVSLAIPSSVALEAYRWVRNDRTDLGLCELSEPGRECLRLRDH
jgi:hypothetical protein